MEPVCGTDCNGQRVFLYPPRANIICLIFYVLCERDSICLWCVFGVRLNVNGCVCVYLFGAMVAPSVQRLHVCICTCVDRGNQHLTMVNMFSVCGTHLVYVCWCYEM